MFTFALICFGFQPHFRCTLLMKTEMWKGLSEVIQSKGGSAKPTSLLTFIENKGDCTFSLHNLLQHLTVPETEKFLPKGCIRAVQLQTHYLKFSLHWTRRTNYFLFLFNVLSYLKMITISPLSLLFILSNSVSFSVSWQAIPCSEPCCSPPNLLQIHLKCLRPGILIQLVLANAEQGGKTNPGFAVCTPV